MSSPTTRRARRGDALRRIGAIARHDLTVWLRNPVALLAALVPPLALGLVVVTLSFAVGRQPVALVREGHGPLAAHMADLVREDAEAYALKTTDQRGAADLIASQQVAAAIVIPADFDQQVAAGHAEVRVVLNNVDVDFADDVRRAAARSVAQFDAPDLGLLGELRQGQSSFVLPNPYRVDVAEHNLRVTNVDYLDFQVVPVLVLLALNIGLLSTGMLVARDHERGTARLLLLAPVRRGHVVLGRLAGAVAATGAVLVPSVLVARAAGWITPPSGHWPALAALLALLTVMSVGLGLLLATVLRRTRSVTMLGMTLATYLFFLGGGFTQLAFLPHWIQTAARLAPTSYAINGLRQALFYPDLTGLGTDLAVLGAVAVGAAALGSLALRRSWSRA